MNILGLLVFLAVVGFLIYKVSPESPIAVKIGAVAAAVAAFFADHLPNLFGG